MGRFSPLDAVRNRTVVDPSGEHVGYIHDVLLDLDDGRIEYLCIALADGATSGLFEAVVPWSAFRVDAASDAHWQVAAGKSVLEAIAQPVAARK